MIAVGHSSLGTIIGLSVATIFPGAPFWAKALLVFLLALASHYAFDWLPHGHYHTSLKKMGLGTFIIFLLDFIGSILFFATLAFVTFGESVEFWLIIIGMLGAHLPDIWDGLHTIGLIPKWRWVRAHNHFHYKVLHWHSTRVGLHARRARPLHKSDVWQLAVFVIAILSVLGDSNVWK